jgi:hypothetical protein
MFFGTCRYLCTTDRNTHKWKASISEILTVTVQTSVCNNADSKEGGRAFSSPRGANSGYWGYVALSMLVASFVSTSISFTLCLLYFSFFMTSVSSFFGR